jgi:para-nitrobenzyl esterase
MHRWAEVSRLALSAAIAVNTQMTLAGASRAAEPLNVDGGAIADVARDALGVRAFKGIPYAAPPVEGLRWKPLQVVQAWSDVRSSTEWVPAACRAIGSARLIRSTSAWMRIASI